MVSRIFFFPDTNLFIQCKPLDQLDWSAWVQYDEVSLLVSRPIQAEIDKQKGGGNNRLAKRARTASSIFREILRSPDRFIEFRSANPSVRVYLRPELKRDESLANQLSYDEPDDQLVGIAKLFARTNEGYDVRVLTHDTGPMATAQLVDLPFVEIPDSWLLAAEVDETQKKINNLLAENARLKSAEPSFEFRVDSAPSGLQADIKLFAPLSQDEILVLMDRIKTDFPPETDFGSRIAEGQSTTRIAKSALGGVEKFTPATDDEILTYQTETYPNWVSECEALLHRLHTQLNGKTVWPELALYISNIGSRPAEDTLITFTASGKFGIQPASYIDEDQEPDPEPEIELPRLPHAPKGTWKARHGVSAFGIQALSATHHLMTDFNNFLPQPSRTFTRDPNGFYYKEKPNVPVRSFSLTCEQFRHRSEEEEFCITIFGAMTPGDLAGVIEARVEAANISAPVIERIPVRVSISEVNLFSEAEKLIERIASKRTLFRS